jgi:hypothetical protein
MRLALIVHQDIGRFQVEMDDAALMRIMDSRATFRLSNWNLRASVPTHHGRCDLCAEATWYHA